MSGAVDRPPTGHLLRPRSATTLPSARERRVSSGRVATPPASPPLGRVGPAMSPQTRRPRTAEPQRRSMLLEYLSHKEPLRVPDRPPVPDYGFDHHNFWRFLQEDGDVKPGRHRHKPIALPQEEQDEIRPDVVTLDRQKRLRIAKEFIERNHHRMWKFRAVYRHQSPQQILDSIVNSMHFDVIMHDLLRREHDYHVGKSSEQMRASLEQRERHLFGSSDPYLASLSTTRTARKQRQERLFMPTYASQKRDFNRCKAAF